MAGLRRFAAVMAFKPLGPRLVRVDRRGGMSIRCSLVTRAATFRVGRASPGATVPGSTPQGLRVVRVGARRLDAWDVGPPRCPARAT